MNKIRIAKSVSKMRGYVPGEQPREKGWVKLNTNEFPYAPTPKIRRAILKELGKDCEKLRLYPNPESKELREAVGEYYGLSEKNVIAGNGSDDVLNLLIRAFADERLSIGAMNPSYSLYPVLANIQGADLKEFFFKEGMVIPYKEIFRSGVNIFFLTNPNAPTGFGFSRDDIEYFAKNFEGILVIDEAYAPFAGYSSAELVLKYKNVVVVGTSSKGFGLAGIRVGWGLSSEEIIEILDRVRDSYNIDRLAQISAVVALRDVCYYRKMCDKVKKEREGVEKFFCDIGWKFYKSSANFIFAKPIVSGKSGANYARNLYEFLRSEKILVRYWEKDSVINDGVRITIGTREQMKKFKESVKRWIRKELQE